MNQLINIAHWIDIKLFRNLNKYRTWLVKSGFFTANEWTDKEVLEYIKR